jgi:hypothetical protein
MPIDPDAIPRAYVGNSSSFAAVANHDDDDDDDEADDVCYDDGEV